MPHPYYAPLVPRLEAVADPVRAANMKKYMKDHFEFYGIPTPLRREVTREFIREHGMPGMEIFDEVCRSLWEEPMREFQHTVIFLMNRIKKRLTPDHFPLIEHLITHKSWWDTVDGLAGWIVGEIMKNHPDTIRSRTAEWMASDNIWLQRTCIIFQLGYKKDTDTELLSGFIEALADHKTFWIRKAIGWALREYSKTDPDFVQSFVDSHELSGLSRREALKVIERNKNR